MKSFFAVTGMMVLVALIFFPLVIVFTGFHYETGRGEHTGYITAAERTGIIFKTNAVYLKTDTQSSQEDQYCVIDADVYTKLQEYARTREQVNAYYFSWLSAGITNCGGASDGIIYKVEPIAK